jgi:hypothetical protein
MKKPKDRQDMHIDVSYEQFSEEGDLPLINVRNTNDYYEFHPNHDWEKEIKRMKADAEWLLKSAEYIEKSFKA